MAKIKSQKHKEGGVYTDVTIRVENGFNSDMKLLHTIQKFDHNILLFIAHRIIIYIIYFVEELYVSSDPNAKRVYDDHNQNKYYNMFMLNIWIECLKTYIKKLPKDLYMGGAQDAKTIANSFINTYHSTDSIFVNHDIDGLSDNYYLNNTINNIQYLNKLNEIKSVDVIVEIISGLTQHIYHTVHKNNTDNDIKFECYKLYFALLQFKKILIAKLSNNRKRPQLGNLTKAPYNYLLSIQNYADKFFNSLDAKQPVGKPVHVPVGKLVPTQNTVPAVSHMGNIDNHMYSKYHGFIGLPNVGNTCYINATVQLLINLWHDRFFDYNSDNIIRNLIDSYTKYLNSSIDFNEINQNIIKFIKKYNAGAEKSINEQNNLYDTMNAYLNKNKYDNKIYQEDSKRIPDLTINNTIYKCNNNLKSQIDKLDILQIHYILINQKYDLSNLINSLFDKGLETVNAKSYKCNQVSVADNIQFDMVSITTAINFPGYLLINPTISLGNNSRIKDDMYVSKLLNLKGTIYELNGICAHISGENSITSGHYVYITKQSPDNWFVINDEKIYSLDNLNNTYKFVLKNDKDNFIFPSQCLPHILYYKKIRSHSPNIQSDQELRTNLENQIKIYNFELSNKSNNEESNNEEYIRFIETNYKNILRFNLHLIIPVNPIKKEYWEKHKDYTIGGKLVRKLTTQLQKTKSK
jgi:hypothetical protein